MTLSLTKNKQLKIKNIYAVFPRGNQHPQQNRQIIIRKLF